jgi:hypothetical protein
MRTIFERLVEELRAWHLFEDRREYPLHWELPGEQPGRYSGAPQPPAGGGWPGGGNGASPDPGFQLRGIRPGTPF